MKLQHVLISLIILISVAVMLWAINRVYHTVQSVQKRMTTQSQDLLSARTRLQEALRSTREENPSLAQVITKIEDALSEESLSKEDIERFSMLNGFLEHLFADPSTDDERAGNEKTDTSAQDRTPSAPNENSQSPEELNSITISESVLSLLSQLQEVREQFKSGRE